MRNIPLRDELKRKPHEARSAKSAPKSAWPAREAAPRRSFGRRLLVLLLSVAAGLAVGGMIIAALPALYAAETRILLVDAADPQSAATNRSPAVAEQVIGELHLDRDPDFARAPWQPPQALLAAGSWVEQQTGRKIPFASDSKADPVERFWDRIEIGHLGRSSRMLTIRAWASDPQRAAAIANAVGRLLIGNGTLIAPALPPEAPGYPPIAPILMVGAVAGVLLGLIAIVLFDSKAHQFNRADEVERASGLPVLAVVPQLDDGGAAIANVLRDPGSPYAESLRKLYEKLHSERWTQAPKVIAISSALPGEGRSTLAASLGRLLASEGGRVLLVDCDWRHPELHSLFRLSNETGLTSLLLDPHIAIDDVIHTDALSGLDIITAGRRNRQAVHKLISEPMKKILATLATGYDLVLLDMPPVLAAEEALLLAGLADKLIFAVRWHHTLRSRATEAMDRILAARGDVLGVVFTRVDLARYKKQQPVAR